MDSVLTSDSDETENPRDDVASPEEEVNETTTLYVTKLQTLDSKNKSLDGLDANPSARKEAVAIFPEEIWRMILGNLTDPQDLWRCSLTCELFADIDILSTWRHGYMMEMALPHLYPHLSRNQLLKCRLVCTGWNRKINSFLEDHPSLRPHDSKRDPRKLEFVNPVLEIGLWRRNTYGFWNPHSNSRHLQRTLTFTGNPFLGRYVTLDMRRDYNSPLEKRETVKNFYNKIYTFLKIYGKEIFYLNLWFYENPFNNHLRYNRWNVGKSRYARLVTIDLFKFLPNLRKLRLSGRGYYEVVQNLVIRPETLPPAPQLDSLEIEDRLLTWNYSEIHDPISHALVIRYHAQLRKLHIRTIDWNEEVQRLEWPRLTELHINMTGIMPVDIRGIGGRMPLLSKLGLKVYSKYSNYFNFDTMMEAICELSSNTQLSTLRLGGLIFEKAQPIRRSALVAPATLETLELEDFLVDYHKPSYTFLLLGCFPHIKNLHIFLRRGKPEDNQSEVELLPRDRCEHHIATACKLIRPDEIVDLNKHLGSGGNVYRSNIWELMSNLNVFTFQWDVYTRDGYEQFLRRSNDITRQN